MEIVIGPPVPRPRHKRRAGWIAAFVAIPLALVAAYIVYALGLGWTPKDARSASQKLVLLPPSLNVLPASDPAALRAVSSEEAEQINAAIPISTAPNPAARPFSVPVGNAVAWNRALDCMTAALYYEAASESDDGLRAVAQVVLNRVRHPAFASSVCGVVFEGSERQTGCQFSFTCDGSLARLPSPASWARARRIGAQALAGSVYAPVGLATHYHTRWVSPYWAPTLVKVAVIGAHIFYRWPGYWGKPEAFTQSYVTDTLLLPMEVQLGASTQDLDAAHSGEIVTALARPILGIDGKAVGAAATIEAPPGAALLDSRQPTRRVAGERWIIAGSGPAERPANSDAQSPTKARPEGEKPIEPAGQDGTARQDQGRAPIR